MIILSYNCSNLSIVSCKGIFYKTILSLPRNFLNHLRTYISTGGGKSGSQAWKKITKKIEKKNQNTTCYIVQLKFKHTISCSKSCRTKSKTLFLFQVGSIITTTYICSLSQRSSLTGIVEDKNCALDMYNNMSLYLICFAVVACIFPPMCCLILIALLQFDEFSCLTCLVVLTVCVSNSATRHICYTLIISSHIFWQFFLKFIVLCSYKLSRGKHLCFNLL